ncbi:MAG: hypothetical protein U5Q44_09375 [Dehalococcoidia bacterium]|nr:hypothetical protein [Dehalococcoidia bacterium]
MPVGFGKSTVSGATASKVTSLEFGPDGRLYTATQDGLVHIFTVVRNGPNDYTATSLETLTHIEELPNHFDDGTPAPSVDDRLVTGLTVVGTASTGDLRCLERSAYRRWPQRR